MVVERSCRHGVSRTALAGDDVSASWEAILHSRLSTASGRWNNHMTTTLGQAEAAASYRLRRFLRLALLGGLILNVMPCVLPVLSIKLLGVVSHGGGERGPVRRSFLASAAGIVFAFLCLPAFAGFAPAARRWVGNPVPATVVHRVMTSLDHAVRCQYVGPIRAATTGLDRWCRRCFGNPHRQ